MVDSLFLLFYLLSLTSVPQSTDRDSRHDDLAAAAAAAAVETRPSLSDGAGCAVGGGEGQRSIRDSHSRAAWMGRARRRGGAAYPAHSSRTEIGSVYLRSADGRPASYPFARWKRPSTDATRQATGDRRQATSDQRPAASDSTLSTCDATSSVFDRGIRFSLNIYPRTIDSHPTRMH